MGTVRVCMHTHFRGLPNYPCAKISLQALWGALSSSLRAQAPLGDVCTSLSSLHILLSIHQRQGAAPVLGQPFKKQGNIMQEHRKSEETGFWAGLARSLCELQ